MDNKTKCNHCNGRGEMQVFMDDTDSRSTMEKCIVCDGRGEI